MLGRSEIVGAVDFGSREVRVVIARKDEDGTVQIIGHGTAPGRGCVSQGVIQDLQSAKLALKRALVEAERGARIKVMSLFCGINGRNVETFLREGHVKLDQEIVEQSHMDDAMDLASRDVLEAGKRIISSVAAQEWYVDDLRVIDPVGITGHVLKTRIHFARIPAVIEDNIVRCIESQRRELEDIIFMPLASSLGCLTPEDRELGVAVLDMGRMTTGLAKLKAARLGITMASDAIEVHGGNGYIESWPVARLLRDAQVNTLWEGTDNILCLDVRRAIEREQADEPFLERIDEAIQNAGEQPSAGIVAQRLDDLKTAIDGWKQLDRETAEPRLFALAQFMSEVYAGALLAEQADWEQREYGDDRKSIIATLYARRYLGDPSPTRGIDAQEDLAITHFDKLAAGALVDERERS